jgi:hypothetical protein
MIVGIIGSLLALIDLLGASGKGVTWSLGRPFGTHLGKITIDQARVPFVAYAIAGLAGGLTFSAQSLATHLGRRSFQSSWIWWYLLNPPIGSMTGLVLGLSVQLGLLQLPSTTTNQGEPAVQVLQRPIPLMLLIGFLGGFFSRRAVQRLGRLLPETEGIDHRFSVQDVSPATLVKSADKATFTVTGSGFGKNTAVRIDQHKATITTDAGDKLIATFEGLPATDAELFLVVENPTETRVTQIRRT